jgi:hypothetical protein
MSTIEFYIPQLTSNTTAATLFMTDISSSLIDLSNNYSGIYSIDVNEDVARKMFRFAVYNSTIYASDMSGQSAATTLTQTAAMNMDKDVGFYIQSGQFPSAKVNYTTAVLSGDAGAAKAINPILSAKYVGHLDSSSFDDNNVATIGQEYMGWVAKNLFTTAKASAIFNNEQDFLTKIASEPKVINYYSKLYDSSGAVDIDNISDSVLTTAQILADCSNNTTTDLRHRNKIARNIFYGIVKTNISRIADALNVANNATYFDVSTNTYAIPVVAGDSFSSYITIDSAASSVQAKAIFGASSTVTIPSRTYRLVLNVVATAAGTANDKYLDGSLLAIKRTNNVISGESPTGASVVVNGTTINKVPRAIDLSA